MLLLVVSVCCRLIYADPHMTGIDLVDPDLSCAMDTSISVSEFSPVCWIVLGVLAFGQAL